jgi:hypothetical protein
MQEKFARLEDTAHGQMLITIQSGDGGPTVNFRLAERHGLEPSLLRGPWPDTEQGWAEARDIFEKTDLQQSAGELARMIDQVIEKARA